MGDLVREGALSISDGYRVRNEELGPAGIPFVRGGDIGDGSVNTDTEDHIRPEFADRVTAKLTRAGDAAFITKGTVGRAGRLRDGQPPVVFAPQVAYWRVLDRGVLDPGFIFYFMRSHAFQTALYGVKAHGAMAADYVSIAQQHDFEFRFPDVDSQRAIAGVLGALDDKIDLNRRMSETLEATARALFQSWFVDFDPVRAKAAGRDPGLPNAIAGLFPDRTTTSEAGAIPDGWRLDVLGAVLAEMETGGRPKGGVSGYTEGIPSIGAESIVGLGMFDFSKTRYVPQAFFDGMSRGHIKSRDVLLYKDGGRPGHFEPHVAMLGDAFPFATCCINEHVYRLRAKPPIGQNYLFFWLSAAPVMEEMRVKGTGVAVPGLNSTQVRSLTTLVPHTDVLERFESIVEPLVARVLACATQSRTLAAIRDEILPKLLSGAIRVPVAERLVEART